MWQSFTMWLRIACLLLGLSYSTPASVFQGRDQAHSLLDRAKRANSGWLEEMKAGNLERECLEEVCSYEEAREVFEHDQATNEFWKLYNVADYCHSSPCQNNGTCSNQPSSYGCLCPLGFSGRNCELEFKLVPDTCLHENGGCEHFCEEGGGSRNCSCAAGYVLAADGQRCLAEEMYPCGTVPVLQGILSEKRNLPDDPRSRIVGGTECPKGHCPWQVLLVYGQKGFCGGVIYTATWILTATHCLENIDVRHLKVVAGEHNLDVEEGSEQTVQVVEMVPHPAYVVKTADNDIALLRLAEPIRFSPYAVPACLPRRALAEQELWAVHLHTVSGWGRRSELGPTSRILRKLDVPRIRTQDCVENSGVTVTANMFCAGYIEGKQDSCKGDSGGPLVTRYRQTWFLLGIVSWGKGCARPGNYGIYTRVSNYLDWIHEHTAKQAVNGTETKI